MKHTNIKKNNLISIILVLALVAGCFATIPLVMSQDSTDKDGTWQILNSSADAVTQIPNGIDDGTVWTDKSIVDNGDGSFAITLSAFGRRWAMTHEEYIERYKPINVVFVLDISGSMGTADVAAMIDATKQAGEMILNANPDNRVAAVYYSNTAREVSTEWRWVDKNNFATTLGALPRPSSGGTTNIVAGLNLAKNLLDNAPNKDLATPVIILMTDGGPNCYYTNTNWQGTAATDGYVSISGVSAGEPVAASETIKRAAIISDAGVRIYTVGYNINGNPLAWLTLNPSNDIGYLAPGITERYINADWVGTSNTLRFSTTSKPVDTNTLRSVDIANAPTLSNLGHTVETIEYFQYNEKFYAPLVPQDLVNSFKEVVNNIMTDLASPIKAGENLVITDVIGEGFVLDGNQNPAITYDAAMHTVTWTIPASQLCLFDPSNWNDGDAPYSIDAATAKMNKVTFTVTAIGEPLSRDIDNYNGKQYYTNNLASSKYVNHEDNLITKDLTNRGWVTYNFVPNTSDYSIEYYYDTLLDASKTDTDTAPIGSVISTYTDKVITGYKFDKTENLPLIISANVADNVIKVFYVKDDSQTKELSYEVAYYLDGVFKETVTVTKTVWINDDALAVDVLDANRYVGYKLSSTVPADWPAMVAGGSVLEAYYVKDDSQTKKLSYTVEYYKDNTKVTSDTKTITETVWINAPNTLTVLPVDTSNSKYVGYTFDHTNPALIPVTIADGSVIKVYYVKETTDGTITLTGLNWNNGNGNGNGGGINQFSVNGVTLKNNKNYMTSASFDTAVKQAPAKNAETAIYSVDERSVQNSSGAYEKVYYVRVALFDSATGVWKIYAGTVSVNNPGGNDKDQQVVLTKIS